MTQIEQHAYSKIAALRGEIAIECCSELVEAVWNEPFHTELSQSGAPRFREDSQQVATWNSQDDQSVCGVMCHVQQLTNAWNLAEDGHCWNLAPLAL